MGLTRLRGDQVAAIVTSLEMRARPPLRPLPEVPLRLVRWERPEPAKYRKLFARVGGPWLWFSRLKMSDAELVRHIHRARTQIHAAVDRAGIEVGLLELTHPEDDWCALDYFALVPELVGQGYGRWLMAQAMALAWRPTVKAVRVHTCTLDHPRALPFYIASGFKPLHREIEIFDDPRLTGALPRDAAPQIPLLSDTAAGAPPVS